MLILKKYYLKIFLNKKYLKTTSDFLVHLPTTTKKAMAVSSHNPMTRGKIPLNRKKQTESRLAAAGLILGWEKSPLL
jgi:hypothetical protein